MSFQSFDADKLKQVTEILEALDNFQTNDGTRLTGQALFEIHGVDGVSSTVTIGHEPGGFHVLIAGE